MILPDLEIKEDWILQPPPKVLSSNFISYESYPLICEFCHGGRATYASAVILSLENCVLVFKLSVFYRRRGPYYDSVKTMTELSTLVSGLAYNLHSCKFTPSKKPRFRCIFVTGSFSLLSGSTLLSFFVVSILWTFCTVFREGLCIVLCIFAKPHEMKFYHTLGIKGAFLCHIFVFLARDLSCTQFSSLGWKFVRDIQILGRKGNCFKRARVKASSVILYGSYLTFDFTYCSNHEHHKKSQGSMS